MEGLNVSELREKVAVMLRELTEILAASSFAAPSAPSTASKW